MEVRIKRAYEPASSGDGWRVLVDRLWPRGLSKESARIDAWARDLAPSNELRRWFGHDPERWAEFRKRYFAELDQKHEQLSELLTPPRPRMTLLYAARDEEHNNAIIFADYIQRYTKRGRRR